MAGREVKAGNTILLRARFLDDFGDPADDVTSLTIDIWEAGKDITMISEAIVQGGVPVSIGQGIYEFSYAVSGIGPDGTWTDEWNGTLTGQALKGVFQFEVSASGTVAEVDTQLRNNNLVTVCLDAGITSLDGLSILEDQFCFDFMTTISPAFTNIRKVRLQSGGFLKNIEDDTIQTAILECSLEANMVTFAPGRVNLKLFEHARREFATCCTAYLLLSNLGNGQLKTKTLGDLHVEYDVRGLRDQIERMRDCFEKWVPQIMAGGGAKAARNPLLVVKGQNDPDRVVASRMWLTTEWGAPPGLPAANDRATPRGHRRALRTYTPRTSRTRRWWW